MSLAWGSLVLVIVLLPGILFFVGTYLPEQFTRETELRSPLGHLAGAVLIAFLLHGFLYALSGSFCGQRIPCISVQAFLEIASFDSRASGSSLSIDNTLFRHRWWIYSYFALTSLAGVLLGYLYGKFSSRRKISGLSRHPWVHSLKVEGLTYAYVLTHVRHDNRVLMYRGFLRAFGLQQDGRFAYMVLTDTTRFYMELSANGSSTSEPESHKAIGASMASGMPVPDADAKPKHRSESLFVIEGEDIANAVFDILAVDAKPAKAGEFHRIVSEEAKHEGSDLSKSEIDEIVQASRRSEAN